MSQKLFDLLNNEGKMWLLVVIPLTLVVIMGIVNFIITGLFLLGVMVSAGFVVTNMLNNKVKYNR